MHGSMLLKLGQVKIHKNTQPGVGPVRTLGFNTRGPGVDQPSRVSVGAGVGRRDQPHQSLGYPEIDI